MKTKRKEKKKKNQLFQSIFFSFSDENMRQKTRRKRKKYFQEKDI